MLSAHRGKPAVSAPALVDTLVKLSQLACDLEAAAELDINPLMVVVVPAPKGGPTIFLKRVLTLEQWALLLESAAAQHAAVQLSDPDRAAKLHAVLEVFKTVPPGAFVEVRVG